MAKTINKAVEIAIDDDTYRGEVSPPNQLIPEKDKNAQWYFKNLQYILSFYNQPVGSINFPSAFAGTGDTNNNRNGGDFPFNSRLYPVQFMIRMMQYYLGKQPNLNYNWLVQDVQQGNLQANWIKGNDVSEFVNYFRGLILNRVSNAEFTAKPLSKDAQSRKGDILNQLMLKWDMAQLFQQFKDMGVEFNPANTPDFETPEDIEKWVDTNYKEYAAIIGTDMANGLWFSNHWLHKCLQAFMHTAITGICAMEHYVENGRNLQKIRMPYQLIWDNRIDDDYGRYDQFAGVVDNMTLGDIFSRFPELDDNQRADIQRMAQSADLGATYNNSNYINWWCYDTMQYRNTVTVATVYWRGKHYLNKKKVEDRYKNKKIKTTDNVEDIDPKYSFDDIYKCSIIGNKYLVNWGLMDNVVEEFGDKSKPLFPIIRFMPNTFMGESISEVARVHKLQDELDMYDFQIRMMIARSKGKVYFIDGSKFDEATTPKGFLEDVASMGIHIGRPSGEPNDPNNNGRVIDVIDWTLDPNIGKLAELYRDKKERMSRILSVSPIALGQQTRYIGLGTQQGTIAQNNLGTSYLIDGFMEWIVMNMRYAVNQAKNLYTINDNKEAAFVIGDRGVKYLKFTKDLRFEDLFVELNINDVIDETAKKDIQTFAQAWSQNPQFGITPLDIIKLYSSNSMTQAKDELELSLKKGEKNKKRDLMEQTAIQNQAAEQQFQQKAALDQATKMMEASMVQLKEDNENYRTALKVDNENWRTQYTQDIQALIKQITILTGQLPQEPPQGNTQPPPQSPLSAQLAQSTQGAPQ